MCDGTALPHCGHLLNCGACQRFAALRVRNRILDVLRFGTPIGRRLPKHDSMKKQWERGMRIVNRESRIHDSTFYLQFIQRAPIWSALRILPGAFELPRLTNAIAVSITMRMRWQVQ
jgi:hypothetical protein